VLFDDEATQRLFCSAHGGHCTGKKPHADDAAVPGPQGPVPGHAAALPHGRFLRAVLRRRGKGRAPARHHADAARALGGAADSYGGGAVSCARKLPGATDPARGVGGHLRTGGRSGEQQGARGAQGGARGNARHFDRCRTAARQGRGVLARAAPGAARALWAGVGERHAGARASGRMHGASACGLACARRAERADLQRGLQHGVRKPIAGAAPERHAGLPLEPAARLAVRRRFGRAQAARSAGRGESARLECARPAACARGRGCLAGLRRAHAGPGAEPYPRRAGAA
jgi:hypothetical protein